MDEYLFIELAKLKADRLELEREQREAAASRFGPEDESVERQRHREPLRQQWFRQLRMEEAVMKTFIAVAASLVGQRRRCSVGSTGAPMKRSVAAAGRSADRAVAGRVDGCRHRRRPAGRSVGSPRAVTAP